MSIEPSDEQLLASGVAEDFGALYERTYPLVRAYLRRRAGARPDLVLDLLAETYARALERRE
jgi:DNA-directed RNA polymerase specialized sigma24 family protein